MTTTLDYLGTVPHSLELHTQSQEKSPKHCVWQTCVCVGGGRVDSAGDTSKGALKVKA